MELKPNHFGLNNPCFFSSFVFIFNIIIAYIYDDIIYITLFSMLLFTSLIVHYTQNNVVAILDKIIILNVVIYGYYVLHTKCFNCEIYDHTFFCAFVVVITFLSTIYIYYYYSSLDIELCGIIGNWYHVLLHFICSLGHNIICIM